MLRIMCQELRRFGESTSVRGIPRVLKSKDPQLTAMWVVAVSVCASLLLWQISVVVIRYRTYDIVTTMSEAGEYTVFPDVTICQTYQMASLFTTSLNWEKYLNDTRARFQRWPLERVQSVIRSVTVDSYRAVWNDLLSKDGYYNSLPLDVTQINDEKGTQNSFVVWCHTADWKSSRSGSCIKDALPRWNPLYYKCFTIEIREKDIGSMSVVMYLDDFGQPGNRDSCCPNEFRSQSSGVRVAIHDKRTPPDTTRGIAISPGSETTIAVSEIDRHRLSEPYGDCTHAVYVGTSNDSLGYSLDVCQQLCHQNSTIEVCGCIDPQNTFTEDQLQTVNYTVCGNQTTANDDAPTAAQRPEDDIRSFRQLHCIAALREDIDGECSVRCQQPCVERRYMTRVSSSGPWPHPAFQLDFFRRFVRNAEYADRFRTYADIDEAVENRSITSQQAVDLVRQLDLITRNFIQLNVVMEQPHPFVIADKPAMTVDVLLSSIGGSLSLWLGMTIMFVFELIELVYAAVNNCYRDTRRKMCDSASSSGSNTV